MHPTALRAGERERQGAARQDDGGLCSQVQDGLQPSAADTDAEAQASAAPTGHHPSRPSSGALNSRAPLAGPPPFPRHTWQPPDAGHASDS